MTAHSALATLRYFFALLLLPWLVMAAAAQTSEEKNRDAISANRQEKVSGEQPDVAEAARLIVKQTNEFRASEDLRSLARAAPLEDAADYFAGYMARTDEYGHTADDRRPTERAKAHGYEPCIVAENIAWQFSTAGFSARELASKFVQGWKESPEHRKNMLDPDVTEIGVAIAHSDETGHYYAVQMFGRPRSESIEVRVANRAATEIEYKLGDESFALPPDYTRTHERCRPSQLVVRLPDSEATEATRRFAIRRNSSFKITRGSSGEIEVQRSPLGGDVGTRGRPMDE